MASKTFKPYVAKSGDIMTGVLYVREQNYISGEAPTSESEYGQIFTMQDNTPQNLAGFQGYSLSNGEEGIELWVRRKINGTWVYNALRLGIDASGNRKVYATVPSAWDNMGSI